MNTPMADPRKTKFCFTLQRHWRWLLLLVTALLLMACQRTQPAKEIAPAGTAPLQLVQTISLPAVEGRIDHLAIDRQEQRLFIAALGNNTLEILDLAAGKWLHTVPGLREPQGVLFLPEMNQLYVTNGGSGDCIVVDGTSFTPTHTIDFGGDADNLRYDPTAHAVYVGYGNGAIGGVDVRTLQRLPDSQLAGHPESFQLEQAGSRLFVNLPEANQIAVVDRQTHTVLSTWPPQEAHANFPVALDEAHHRLFVGFRQPARLMVFDTEISKVVADLDSVSDADDIFYDPLRKRIYVIGGEGIMTPRIWTGV
jgi:DNA-binding beta-propeller fold protein YncE